MSEQRKRLQKINDETFYLLDKNDNNDILKFFISGSKADVYEIVIANNKIE